MAGLWTKRGYHNMSNSIPMTQADQVRENIAKLQEALLTAHPTMPILLQQIHRQLKDDPALVTVISEEEIGVIVSGLSTHTGVLLQAAEKAKGSKKGSLKNLGLDDI